MSSAISSVHFRGHYRITETNVRLSQGQRAPLSFDDELYPLFVWKDQALMLELDEKPVVRREAEEMEDDDDLTASEGEFEDLPAGPIATGFTIPSVKQESREASDENESDVNDTVDENEILPLTLAKPASFSHKRPSGAEHVEGEPDPPRFSTSPPPATGPSEINRVDLRGKTGQRRGKSGRTLLRGQSDSRTTRTGMKRS